MASLLTQKDYARRRGISAQYVNKLVRQGRIQLREGKVDPTQADRARSQKQRASVPRAKQRGNAHGGGRPARDPGVAATSMAGAGRPSATESLTAARAAEAGYQARLRQLDFQERTRQLLPAQEVLEAERRKNANIRLRFRGLARALAPLMARTAAVAECERLLLEEIDHQLEELAQDPLGAIGPPLPSPAPAGSPGVQSFAVAAP